MEFSCPKCRMTWHIEPVHEVLRYCPNCGERVLYQGQLREPKENPREKPEEPWTTA